jgi:hypothetical protein
MLPQVVDVGGIFMVQSPCELHDNPKPLALNVRAFFDQAEQPDGLRWRAGACNAMVVMIDSHFFAPGCAQRQSAGDRWPAGDR